MGAIVAVLAGTTALPAAAAPAAAPKFSFSESVVRPGEAVTLRLTRRPQPFSQPLRVYLVPEPAIANVRSRFDPRLTLIGSVARTRATVTFTVPPLEPGLYSLAYWCSRCKFARGKHLAVLRTPLLRIEEQSSPGGCPVTTPNGHAPPGAQPSIYLHGTGALWVFLPLDGVFETRETDGALFNKMIWLATGPGGRRLLVRYERLDAATSPLSAETIAGQLSGYNGESWASRMHFTVGCWKVTGRVGDASLVFVVEIVQA